MAGDPAVLQRTLTVNGTALPVIGVAPDGLGGVFASGEPHLWITFALSDLVFRDAGGRPVHARDAGANDKRVDHAEDAVLTRRQEPASGPRTPRRRRLPQESQRKTRSCHTA
jgi:hypothetical protein